MQFIVIFTNKPRFFTEGMPDDFAERMRDDTAHLRKLYADGIVRDVWTLDTAERGGVALFEADSLSQLETVVADIPFVNIDYNDYEILPLAPYPGFS